MRRTSSLAALLLSGVGVACDATDVASSVPLEDSPAPLETAGSTAPQSGLPRLLPITSRKQLLAHLDSEQGLLFIHEPWSMHSEAVRGRLPRLRPNLDGQVALLSLESPEQPGWLFEELRRHHRLVDDEGTRLLDYSTGDGALIWSSKGTITRVAARPNQLSDQEILHPR